MFDKLIESNSTETEFKPRRKFFMMSSVLVGVLFLTAVVISLYAQDIDLGTNDFEIAEILAPVAADAPEPEPPREQPEQRRSDQNVSDETTRQILQARVDQSPTQPPTAISTTRNKYLSMPEGRFKLNPDGVDGNALGNASSHGNAIAGTGSADSVVTSEPVETTPPPAIPPKVDPPKRTVSLGPVNGIAKYLPKPQYPAAAIVIRAGGPVTVQVTIDEEGNVISAKAVSGHPTLRAVSERAALSAKFTPTLLSKVPVKVTGIITYNFTRQQ